MIQLGHDLPVAKVPSHVAANHAFTQSSTHISSSASPTTLRNARAYHMSREDKLKPQLPVMSWTAKTPPKSFPREDSDALIQGESPYSPTLTGKIAALVLIVSGPGSLAISDSEKANILSEVQIGLDFWTKQAPAFHLFFYTVKQVSQPPTIAIAQVTQLVMMCSPILPRKFGFSTGQTERDEVAQYIKDTSSADGAFVAFFSKYTQSHFAYAYFGGGPTYMQYSNDGWGSDQIDRVFAHEMGHTFNAPDDTSCKCKKRYGKGICTDTNDNCAQSGGYSCTQDCIMDSNDLKHICDHSKKHVGWC